MNTNAKIFSETRSFFEKMGLPLGDYVNFSNKGKEFEAGGHYGIELSSMNNLNTILAAIELAKYHDLPICRLIECRGIVRLPDKEIKSMVDVCAKENIGLLLSIGPRAISGIGGFVGSNNGKRIGYRLRGMEGIIHAVEDVRRAISLGVNGFLIYDEGLLFLLNRMRREGILPENITYKYSVHAGCANPLSAQLLEQCGADSINIVPDLDICAIRSFRSLIKVPLDIFTDTAKEAGGFLRTYEVPEMIYYASPVYLKCGAISQQHQNHLPTSSELEERVKQARNVYEHIQRYLPEAKIVNMNEKTLAIPGIKLSSSTSKKINMEKYLEKTLSI